MKILTFDELLAIAPTEIKDYITKAFDTPQGTDWHPEGNVGIHNRLVYDRTSVYDDINLALVAFFHDLGKVDVVKPNKKGGWSAHGHERISANLVERHKQWISRMGGDFKDVKEIVENHMRIKQMDEMRPHKKEMMRNLKNYDKLLQFTKCDDMRTLSKEELNQYK